jgi:hypothetical protein
VPARGSERSDLQVAAFHLHRWIGGRLHLRSGNLQLPVALPDWLVDRLWVRKRIGTGWTLNYARPAAYWITAFLLVFVGVIVYFSLHTGPPRFCR